VAIRQKNKKPVKTFDFTAAFADLKKSRSIKTAQKKLDVIFKQMQHWQNSDNIAEKPAEHIIKIGRFLNVLGEEFAIQFFERFLSSEFDELRSRFDHYDLAYLYIHIGAYYSSTRSFQKKTHGLYQKAESHLESIEIDKYGIENGLRLHASYHRTRAADAYRTQNFDEATKQIYQSRLYLNQVMMVLKDPEKIQLAMKAQYDLENLKIVILNKKRLFGEVLEQKEILEKLRNFVKRHGNEFRELVYMLCNFSVAHLCVGEIQHAIKKLKEAENLCLTHQKLELEEFLLLRAITTYAFLGQCLQTRHVNKPLYMRIKKSIQSAESNRDVFFHFLLEWGMSIQALKNRNFTLHNPHFIAAKKLALKCELEDFAVEWNWFKDEIEKQSSKGLPRRAPLIFFRTLF